MRASRNRFKTFAGVFMVRFSAAVLSAYLVSHAFGVQDPQSLQKVFSFSGLFSEGLEQLKSGNHEDAVVSFKNALAVSPNNIGAKIHLTRACLGTNNPDTANVLIEEVLAIDSTNAFAFFVQGRVQQCLQEDESAIAAYEKSIDLRDENPYAYNNLGLIYLLEGKYNEAVSSLEMAVEQNGNIVYFHNNLGMAYEGIGELARARESFQAALEIDQNYVKAGTNLSRIENLLGINQAVEPVEDGTAGLFEFESDETDGVIESVTQEGSEVSQSLSPVPDAERSEIAPPVLLEGGREIMRAGALRGEPKGGVIVKVLGASCLAIIFAVAIFVRSHRRSDFTT